MIDKRRKTVLMDDLLNYWVGEREDMVDLEIIVVLDHKGDTVVRGTELEVVYEMTFEVDA